MKIQQFKNIATRIKNELEQSSGKLTHTRIMEIMAKSMGFHDYNGCKATFENPENEKPFREIFITFHMNKNDFQTVWELRQSAITEKYMSISISYHEKYQVVTLGTDFNTDFIKEQLAKVINKCLELKKKINMTIRSCEQIDFEYDSLLIKKIEQSLDGKLISSEEATKILGFDVEDFRKKDDLIERTCSYAKEKFNHKYD